MTAPLLRVVLVAAPADLADALRRELPAGCVSAASTAPVAPRAAVHVFWLDVREVAQRAGEVVAWAHRVRHPVGLVGVVERGDSDEREELLAAGFDDAVTGMPSARELAVRARAVHRRVHRAPHPDGRVRFAGLALDLANHMLWAHGLAIALTPVELAVMRALIDARGKPLSRVQLLEAAWGEDGLEITDRAVDNVILRLRRKLPKPDAIETVRGVGFRIAS